MKQDETFQSHEFQKYRIVVVRSSFDLAMILIPCPSSAAVHIGEIKDLSFQKCLYGFLKTIPVNQKHFLTRRLHIRWKRGPEFLGRLPDCLCCARHILSVTSATHRD